MVVAAGGQTNRFSEFKVDSICLPMFPHCGSFSITRRPLPYAKLSGTNREIDTCCLNFAVWQPNGKDGATRGFQGYGEKNSWLVVSVKELSRQQSLSMNFRDLLVRGLAIRGSTSGLLIEKFPQQVPINFEL